MDRRLIELKSWGCDIKGAMERFLDDEEFYFECYEEALEDVGFEQLKGALDEHDVKLAFEHAHSLKGIIANLGLTSLFEIITDIVEPLRIGQEDGVAEKYEELLKERDRYASIR